ncbi:MAG: hypothetical protein V1692_00970 [bacterium]
MDQRKENLLIKIVEEHIKTAQPVGSSVLVNKYFDLSSATLRNEMADLEKEGYLRQPHTSAGRVPTETGYRYYLEHFLKKKQLNASQKRLLDKTGSINEEPAQIIKNLAKAVAELSGNTVFVAFDHNNVYYTGLTNLFTQPEFENPNLVRNMSRIIDRFDEVIGKMFANLERETTILLGEDNPFSDDCSCLVADYGHIVFGILGPTRMDYGQNLALIEYIKELINE